MGLVPFYFLTPVHQSVMALFETPTPTSVASTPVARTATPTPARADPEVKVGADAVSVPAPTTEASRANAAVPVEVTNDPRYAFLLLGYGGAGHDGAYLTDSMMIVIVDPDQKTLTLLSIPRDSWVPLAFDGTTADYNKVNTAYAFAQDDSLYPDRLARYAGKQGAGVFASDTVARITGIPIRYYVGLDFSGFRQMIDAAGGVDVVVPNGFAARYPANDDPSVDASWTVVRFAKGMQHMSGERAIEFARARETIDDSNEGSDFARSRRQRLIIEAFKQRVLQPGGLVHLPQLLAIGARHVDTNYAVPDIAALSQLILDWKDVRFFQAALSSQNYLEDATGPDGAYALVPSSTAHDWAQARAFVRRLWKDPRAGTAISQTHVVVENDTGVAGAAGQVSETLQSLGYVVDAPVTGTPRATSALVDGTGQHVAETLAPLLEADLGLTNLTVEENTASQIDGVLKLALGSDDLQVTKLAVNADADAPSSAVGIQKFGVWAPENVGTDDVGTATPAADRRATTSPTRTAGSGSATPSGTTTAEVGTPVVGATRVGSGLTAVSTGQLPIGTPAAVRPSTTPVSLTGTSGPAPGSASGASPTKAGATGTATKVAVPSAPTSVPATSTPAAVPVGQG
jgi:LCP family protein required for cell wall assembly